MATDQEIRDAGILYMPKQKYLQNPYELPIAPVPSPTSEGIVNTNAFTNSGGGGGGALQVGDPMMNFDNYYNYTGNKYMQNQDTPNVDMTYDQKLQSNFMGMPSYRQQQLTGPDMGEYIGSGTNIPLEQTMAGKIQSGVQGAGKGIKNLMGMLPTPSNLLNKFGVQNFNSLSPADQLFIKTNTGYRGPTVFGENTGGGNVDPFGLNVESLMGNYAEGVRKNETQLTDTLTKDRGEGIKFNEITGVFEAIDPNDTSQKTKELINRQNKNTKMIRQKFLFRRAQVNQQKKDQRDIDKETAVKANNNNNNNDGGSVTPPGFGITPHGNYVNRFEGGDPGQGQGQNDGPGNTTDASGTEGEDQDRFRKDGGLMYAKGGRAGYFFGGRVGFKNGGLASIL